MKALWIRDTAGVLKVSSIETETLHLNASWLDILIMYDTTYYASPDEAASTAIFGRHQRWSQGEVGSVAQH